MTVRPQQVLVEKHLEGLGFNLKQKSKKDCKIDLEAAQKDWR
jgi:hypothetical protein